MGNWLLIRRRTIITTPRRAAVYVGISAGGQVDDRQRRDLQLAAVQRGWSIGTVYADEGVTGVKRRAHRPGLVAMLKDAARGRFDVVMAWSVDRLSHSSTELIGILQELHAASADLFLHEQAIDTTTETGRNLVQTAHVFADLDRIMARTRVREGLARARVKLGNEGRALGRPRIKEDVENAIRQRLQRGEGIVRLAKDLGVGVSTVQRVRRETTPAQLEQR